MWRTNGTKCYGVSLHEIMAGSLNGIDWLPSSHLFLSLAHVEDISWGPSERQPGGDWCDQQWKDWECWAKCLSLVLHMREARSPVSGRLCVLSEEHAALE